MTPSLTLAAILCLGRVAVCGAMLLGLSVGAMAQDARPRLFVTTDIGGDPDDQQSLVRLLAHADGFRIEGLVASSRGTPGELEGPQPQPQQIIDRINAYGQQYDNLLLHSPNFPDPTTLLTKVSMGNAMRGMSAIGAGNDTPGSNALIAAVDASPETLNVAIWGGATELAQALFDVQTTRTAPEVNAFVNKLSVHAINDQDGYAVAAEGTLSWIKQQFPQMRIIDPTPAGASPDDTVQRFNSTYRGFYQNDSASGGENSPVIPLVAPGVEALNDTAWADANVAINHGALGETYPTNVQQNPQTARNTTGVKEGDTPAWLFYFQNGLNTPERPDFGGWGGRYAPAGGGTNHFVPAFDDLPDPTITDPAARAKWTVARHREAYQNEFAARMDWFVDDFATANHAPEPVFGYDGPQIIDAEPDDFLFLISEGWYDPDNDGLEYSWWFYEDASIGTLPQTTLDQLASTTSDLLLLDLTGVANGSILHLIMEVRDTDPTIPLTRYERFVINVGSATGLAGDYNNSGLVEQNDLDLVLANWGVDTGVTGVPAGWINDLPDGLVEQSELTKVLSNWGVSSAPSFGAATVPEPSGLALLGAAALGRRRR